MTMTQQERDALSQNWDQARSQIEGQFPGLTDDDFNQGRQNPDQFAATVASKTGQDQSQVEQTLRQVAQGLSSGQQGNTKPGSGSQSQRQS
jgi:hypothetical protein